MSFFIKASKPEDWKLQLAEPDKHWKDGYSAKELAYCWMNAGGFPISVKTVFNKSKYGAFDKLQFLAGFVEYKVPLPGGGHPSQNDILVLARNERHLTVIAVEGKVSESFGETVGEWLKTASKGKEKRLNYLSKLLKVDLFDAKEIRYQLVHRVASALIVAEKFKAMTALMLVHSFSPNHEWFEDYANFARLFGIKAKVNSTHFARKIGNIDLYLAWVSEKNFS
jgi:hypothetical protein